VLTCSACPSAFSVTACLYLCIPEVDRVLLIRSASEEVETESVPRECDERKEYPKGEGRIGGSRSKSLSLLVRAGEGVGLGATFAFSGKTLKNLFLMGSQSMPCGAGKGGAVITAL
jgi:hypothetical protein